MAFCGRLNWFEMLENTGQTTAEGQMQNYSNTGNIEVDFKNAGFAIFNAKSHSNQARIISKLQDP
jgi:hypothetical protein